MLIAGSAQADVFNMGGTRDPTTGTWTGLASLEFVTVGDPGNAADTAVRGSTGYGAVPYVYQMGKYDVTVGQYCQFLNAVAKTDTYGLYNSGMATGIGLSDHRHCPERQFGQLQLLGHGQLQPRRPIVRSSMSPGAMRHGSATGCKTASRPGPRGSGTTETGAYTLNGATHNPP